MTGKRFVFLLIVVPLVLVLAAAAYVFYTNSRQGPQQPAEPTSSSPAAEEPAAEAPLKLLVEERVVSQILGFSEEIIWFMTEDGRMVRTKIEPGGELEEFPLPERLNKPIGVIWPQDGNDFIVAYTASGETRYKFYHAENSAFVDLPPALSSPAYLSDSVRIAYKWRTEEGRDELKVSNADGSNFRTVTELFRSDYELAASSQREEAVLWTRDDQNPTRIFLVDLINGQFKDLGEPAGYKGAAFSPDGSKLLAARIVGHPLQTPLLVVFDLNTGIMSDLAVFAEIQQTVWSQNSEQIIFATPLGFEQYDLTPGRKTTLYSFREEEQSVPELPDLGLGDDKHEESDFDEVGIPKPRDLLLHPREPIVFFVDEKTGHLHRLDLQQ